MQNIRWLFSALSLLLLLLPLHEACTAIGVTPRASKDQVIFVAHTDDAGGEAGDVRLVDVPRKPIIVNQAKMPTRPVYLFNSGYPRVVSSDRAPDYRPVSMYNNKKVKQSEFKPLGSIPDISPLEVINKDNQVVKLSSNPSDYMIRNKEFMFRYAYFDQDYGIMNEVQLSIVESTCGARTVGWSKNLPYGHNLFGIAELTKVALERCVTARCAIELMGEFAVKYGFYSEDSGDPANPGYSDSAEALIIGDRLGEVWVFHVLTGINNSSAIWAAQKVPNGEITALANGFTIREIDFTDNEHFMYSANIKESAIKLGFYSVYESVFDFTKVFGHRAESVLEPLYIGRRIWRVFDLLAPSLNLDSTLGSLATVETYPFSIKPDKPVVIEQIFEILKDHYEGTPYDMTKTLSAGPFGNPNRFSVHSKLSGGWERPISIWRSLFSFVSEIRVNQKQGVLYYGPDKPHGTVFFPFSTTSVVVEDEFKTGLQSQFDAHSAWRAFNFVNNWAMLRYDRISAQVRKKQLTLQEEAFRLVRKKYKVSYLTEFKKKAVKEWWQFAWDLVAMFSDGYLITGEGPGQMKNLGYPDKWLENTEYCEWPGDTFHPPGNSKPTQKPTRRMHPTKKPSIPPVPKPTSAPTKEKHYSFKIHIVFKVVLCCSCLGGLGIVMESIFKRRMLEIPVAELVEPLNKDSQSL